MIGIKIEKDEVTAAMKRVSDTLTGPKRIQLFKTLSAIMFADVIDHFSREQSPDGKWERWKDPKTGNRIGRRPTKRGGSKMLLDTGRLRGSLKPGHDQNEANVHTDVEYGPVQNFGSLKKDHPSREFMWLSDKAQDRIVQAVGEEVERAWNV